MRADLLVGGLFLLVIGIVLDITLIGAVIGLPIGAIGVIMMIAGFFMGGGSGNKSQTKGQQSSDEKQRRYQRYQAEQYNRHRQEIEAQERRRSKQ